MRILIQDSITKDYFSGETWAANLAGAMDFDSTSQAERFCLEKKFASALIVVKFKDDSDDIKFSAGARSTLLVSGKAISTHRSRIAS